MDFDFFSMRALLFTSIVIIACKNISFLNYYSKFVIYVLHSSFWATVLMPYFLFKPRDVMNLHTGARIMKYAANMIGIKYQFEGLEKLNQDKTMVVVANHQSSLDVLGMFNMWWSFGKLTVITKIEVLFAGPFGFSSWLAGLVFINRRKSRKAADLINDAVVEMTKTNTKLWVFPEGTRKNTGKIHEFKKGAFHAAIHAQVPIIPVVFSSYKTFLDSKNKILKNGEIKIAVLDEIPTKGMTIDDIDGLMEKTHNLMSIKYKEISNL